MYTTGRDGDGKRQQKSFTVQGTKSQAQAELRRVLRELDTGAYVEPTSMTVRQYLDHWLEDYARTNVSAKTFEVYRHHIRSQVAPALGHHPLPKLSPLHIQGFYSQMLQTGRKDGQGGLKARTVLHFHRILREALQQAVKWQLVARNVADAVEPPRPERQQMRVLDEAQTVGLIAGARGTRLYLPIVLAVATGARRGEILGLMWSDIDLAAGTITIRRSLEQTAGNLRFKPPKTGKSRRVVPVPAFAAKALVQHRAAQDGQRKLLGAGYQEQDLVIARPDGTPVKPDRFSQEFADLIRRLELPHARFHDLRHGHATQLFKEGIHAKVVSERLGHSGVGITLDTYSHVVPGMQEEAARRLEAAYQRAGGD
jgi:integrase